MCYFEVRVSRSDKLVDLSVSLKLFVVVLAAARVMFMSEISHGTRKAEVLNSLIINTTAKANDTTDILQTFR